MKKFWVVKLKTVTCWLKYEEEVSKLSLYHVLENAYLELGIHNAPSFVIREVKITMVSKEE